MPLDISDYLSALRELCVVYSVKRLALFGSAIRGDFDPETSDLDFLVEFSENQVLGPFARYFGFKEDLEQLFQRPVDLVEAKAIKNPYFRQAVSETEVLIYGPERQEADLRYQSGR